VSLVDEYEEEEEEIPIEDLELVDPDPTHTKANPELVDPDHIQIEANLELANPDHTQTKAVEEETHDPMTATLSEETLGENLIIESSPKIQEPEKFIKDMISLSQYPQEEFSPIVFIKDLFLEINDPFFHNTDPVGIHQSHKVSLISLGLIPDIPSCILFYPINPELFSYFLPY